MNEYETILQKTNGGLDIFKHYLGDDCTKGAFKNPYRADSRASCRLYRNKTKDEKSYYYLQDYGDSEFCGNCFSIVAKILNYNIRNDFKHLLEQIDKDMNLDVFSFYDNGFQSKQPVLKKVVGCGGIHKSCSISEFKLTTKPFSEKELSYWHRYGITEETLQRYDVKSVKACTFIKADGKSFSIVSSELIPVYGYYFNGGLGIKFYRPKAENRFMYVGNLPKPYIFGWNKLPPCGDYVFITGGEKDVLSLASHGFSAIALNSETAKVPDEILSELAERFSKVVFLYDTDATGIKESTERVNEYKGKYNVTRLQLPLAGTKQEKDISDYFALGNGREEFVELLKGLQKWE